MEVGHVSAIISAVAGISGVLLGNSFVAFKEWHVSRAKRQKETVYLAIIVVSHLDRFVEGCLNVARDDGTECGRPASDNEEEYVPTTTPPEFRPLDIEVEWKMLPQNLLHSIFQLPDQRQKIQGKLAEIMEFDSDYPDHTEYFHTRRRDYAELGLQAAALAQRLRSHSGLPLKSHVPGEWNQSEDLADVIKDIDNARDAQIRRDAENPFDLDIISASRSAA